MEKIDNNKKCLFDLFFIVFPPCFALIFIKTICKYNT